MQKKSAINIVKKYLLRFEDPSKSSQREDFNVQKTSEFFKPYIHT